jgi:hypothetical protein
MEALTTQPYLQQPMKPWLVSQAGYKHTIFSFIKDEPRFSMNCHNDEHTMCKHDH